MLWIERQIWNGPRIPCQQSRDDGIRWTTRRRDLTRIGNARARIQPDSFALAFVSEVEERLIAFDWTTNRAAELIVAKRRLRIWFGIEDITCVELVVAEKLEERTVKVVCAGLGDDIDDRAGVAAILSLEV